MPLAAAQLRIPSGGAGMVASVGVAQLQSAWAAEPVATRVGILRSARHLLAERTDALCAAIPRVKADTLAAEVLPLLAAFRYLEKNADAILKPKRLGGGGRPFWLTGVSSEIERVPLGRILVIGPGNYPLFLPGVQTIQALVAGNEVVWKPGAGGRAVAEIFSAALAEAGLPDGLLRVTDESIAAAEREIAVGVDKVVFTGSATTGRTLMRSLADSLTPCVAELSGCDAVIVLPSASLDLVAGAMAFGMRLNGSATCMAPRRILLVDATPESKAELIEELLAAFAAIEPVTLAVPILRQVNELLQQALNDGARIHGGSGPTLLTEVQPDMAIAQADLFAPVAMLLDIRTEAGLLAAMEACPYALTAAIFGDEAEARKLASKLTAGTVLINDLIVPTADPRLPFGGRKASGFGVTRGAEGLLEMTAVKVVATRTGKDTRHLSATGPDHAALFEGVIQATHAATWTGRFNGIRKVIAAGRKLI
jgi:aldehyde dehydrogenase (NAD+)